MSALSRFLKENKTVKKNRKYAPTVTLQDENGKPLEWEFRHITSKENDELREECTRMFQCRASLTCTGQNLIQVHIL